MESIKISDYPIKAHDKGQVLDGIGENFGQMKKDILKKISKCCCFVVFGTVLFVYLQNILTPKWRYPAFNEAPADTLEEFYQVAKNSDVQVVFLGGSHVVFAVDPMKIYDETGIVSFNLGSSTQTMPISYTLCSEMFAQGWHPSVVILDVSTLYSTEFYTPHYRYILDNMPFGASKVQLAKSFASKYSDKDRLNAFLSAFLPMYEYHSRWDELEAHDFEPLKDRNFYRKGYYLTNYTVKSDTNEDVMNTAAEMLHSNNGWVYTWNSEEFQCVEDRELLYDPQFNDTFVANLMAMKQLCTANGAELLLVKIPAVYDPQKYSSAWTKIKSELMHKFALEYDMKFLDLLYDTDLAIDWSTDSADGGKHLNYNGARKTTAYFADYLHNELGLTGAGCESYEEDISIYDAVCQLLNLRSAGSLPAYLNALSGFDDVTVFFSASDDMANSLTQEEQNALNAFGLHANYISYRNSFVAIKERDTLLYEAVSNRVIEQQGTLACGSTYSLTSSGWLTGAQSEIKIDEINYSMNHRGLNIVVLDNASGLVLDSVAFDTWDVPENRSAIRNSGKAEKFLREYEQYLMIQDAKNGIGA